uniref:Uncharacterized protein n=1 Tax=Chelonoidis abingdonii TaxID=106734 RepID=A0A8C0GX16_CHEAB
MGAGPSLDTCWSGAIAHEIYTDLVEDACLGLCFEVHRAVKCGYFFLDDTDPDSMKDFGEFPLGPLSCSLPLPRTGDPGNHPGSDQWSILTSGSQPFQTAGSLSGI